MVLPFNMDPVLCLWPVSDPRSIQFGGFWEFELFQSGWPKMNMGLSEKRVTPNPLVSCHCAYLSLYNRGIHQ